MKKLVLCALAMLPMLAASKVQASNGEVLFEGKVAYSEQWVWVKFDKKVTSFFGLRTELAALSGGVDHLCQYQIDAVSVPTIEHDLLKMKQTVNNEWRGTDFNPIKPSSNGIHIKLSKLNASPVPPPFSPASCTLTVKQSDGIVVPGRPPVAQEKIVTLNTPSEVRVIYKGATASKLYDVMKGAKTAKVSDDAEVSVTSRQLNVPGFNLICNRLAFTGGATNECNLEVTADKSTSSDVIALTLKAGTKENALALKTFGIKVDADLVAIFPIADGITLENKDLDLVISINRTKIGPVSAENAPKERTYTGAEAADLYDHMNVEAVLVAAVGPVGALPSSGYSKRFAFSNFSLVCFRDKDAAKTDCTAKLTGARKVIRANTTDPETWKIELAKEHGQFIASHYEDLRSTTTGVVAEFATGLNFACDYAGNTQSLTNCRVKLEIKN